MKIHKFKLPLHKDNEILEINKKIIVVSIFGKSRINSASFKTWCLDSIQGYPILRPFLFEEQNVDPDSLCEIDGFFDSKKKIIYLHLRGIFDLDTLIKTYNSINAGLETQGFLQIWSQLKNKYAKTLLYLFLTSHILFAVHPNQTLDLSYIQLFRALDQIRQQSQPAISEILNTIENIPKEWATNGRLGSPRLLFIFENSSPMNKINSIKKLAHSIEDQIYRILRKSRIVSNNSYNCLFAIPPNQEFVYVRPKSEQKELDLTAHLVNSLINFCQDPNSFSTETSDSDQDVSFETFLMKHVDEAFNKGFDDNVSRHSQTIHFEVPKIKLWFQAANKLFEVLINSNMEIVKSITEDQPNEEGNENISRPLKVLEKLLDTDVSFSEARCSKILPLATARYMENLPSHYSREHHNTRLAHALCVLAVNARGPLLEKYSDQLQQDCERVWIPDRQLCETLSLTGNPCTKPIHTFSSSSEDRDAGSPEHCSGIRYISSCDCGRRQSSREDPYTAKAANYEFYQQIGVECGCNNLERHHFPVFQPTTQQFRAAQLFPTTNKSGRRDSGAKELPKDLTAKDQATTPHTQAFSLAGFASGTSLGSCDVLPEDSAGQKDVSQTDSSSQHPIVIEVPSEQNESKEKSLVRQPSTTEYLPSMPHTLSPVGLLPRYPCWSLVCLGPSSLYSHNVGLHEQWHEGFLPGCAHLLPWDLTVRLEGRPGWVRHNPRKNQPSSSQPNSNPEKNKELNEFVVKIFIGVEYECPRGHRFMCASPDRVLKTSGQGIVKDNGNRVTSSDMPLYFPCPCRSSKPLVAQLMRIHVVTPKAPVHVTLNPRVQPAPASCPIFVPGSSTPLRLSQSAYWVLRLPFIYVGDEGPIPSPKDASGAYCGRFLAGCYGISEMTEETK